MTTLVKTKSAKLLKLSVGDLQRLRKKLTGVTDPSLLVPVAVEAPEPEKEADTDLLDITSEPVDPGVASAEDPGVGVQELPKG